MFHNKRTDSYLHIFAKRAEERGGVTLADGRPFSMAIYETWNEQQQREFMADYMLKRWASLTPQLRNSASFEKIISL